MPTIISSDHILQIIKLRGVDNLNFAVHKFDPSIDASELLSITRIWRKEWISVKLQRELSTLIDRLHILQHKLDDIAENQPYLLGVFNEDWSRIIIEMLSNKLSRLSIFNFNYGEYLSKRNADFLRKV